MKLSLLLFVVIPAFDLVNAEEVGAPLQTEDKASSQPCPLDNSEANTQTGNYPSRKGSISGSRFLAFSAKKEKTFLIVQMDKLYKSSYNPLFPRPNLRRSAAHNINKPEWEYHDNGLGSPTFSDCSVL